MARILSQTLIRESHPLIRDPPPSYLLSGDRSPLSARLLNHRGRSKRPEKAQLIEIDLEAEASASASSEVEVLGMRRVEDAIHGIMVRRSAPNWLPFIPGSSYWVPPRKQRPPYAVMEMIRRASGPMSEEEVLSFRSVRGWPSTAYFVEGVLPQPLNKSPDSALPQPGDKIPKKGVPQSDDEN